ncbi:MAG TPA: hypothetical protein VFR85_18945 [Anaeromyxobacteraceae bacterium]|nr:hypothetical protein [Anaeromyxobacteraceae bacterium]
MISSILVTMLVSSAGAGTVSPPAAAEPRPLPVNVSLVPPLSVNSVFDSRTVNAFALDLLVGDSAELRGVQLSGIGSRNGEVRGVQIAGLGNWVEAGAYDRSGDARGAQVAGALNWTGGALRGAQVAGALNVAGLDSSGVQVAGAVNVASAMSGVQVAGAVNVASDARGVQVAAVNVSRQVNGVQLGLVNVAEDADFSVGAFSWIDHGTHDATLAATEYGMLAEADTGGRILYGLLTGGVAYGSSPRRYLLGFGLGWRALATEAVTLDVQATTMRMVDEDVWTDRYLSSARAAVALRVAGPLSVFAGPTFNVFVDREAHKIDPVGYGWKVGSDTRLWPGILAGLRLF